MGSSFNTNFGRGPRRLSLYPNFSEHNPWPEPEWRYAE
jgi:hypothetical protein